MCGDADLVAQCTTFLMICIFVHDVGPRLILVECVALKLLYCDKISTRNVLNAKLNFDGNEPIETYGSLLSHYLRSASFILIENCMDSNHSKQTRFFFISTEERERKKPLDRYQWMSCFNVHSSNA